jgi:hypothetical protein
MRQGRITRNLGKDTHVRNQYENIFRDLNHECFQIVMGEIKSTLPEPLHQQTLVNIKFSRGGEVTNVAYPGAFIDPVSGNLHGLYEGPIANQMVAVAFENGNMNNPFVVQRFPYQGVGNTSHESKYMTPLQNLEFHPEDIILGHQSGSYLVFSTGKSPSTKTPGTFYLYTIADFEIDIDTDLKITAQQKGTIETISDFELKSQAKFTITATDEIKFDGSAKVIINSTDNTEITSQADVKITTTGQLNVNSGNLTVDV